MVVVSSKKPFTMSAPKHTIGKTSTYFLVTALIILILIVSCRKIDRLTVDENPVVRLENGFFTNHAPTDAVVKSVLEFVKRENDKHRFVFNLIDKIGYPYWDKAI